MVAKCHEYRELDCIDGEPVEFEWTSRTHNTSVASRDPKDDGREPKSSCKVRRSNHLHVDVYRHGLVKRRKQRNFYFEFCR